METFPLTVKIIYESEAKSAPYVAFTPELDVASQGATAKEAVRNLREAVEGFLEAVAEMGTLDEVLAEAGLVFENGKLVKRPFPKFETIKVPVQLVTDLLNAPHYTRPLQKAY